MTDHVGGPITSKLDTSQVGGPGIPETSLDASFDPSVASVAGDIDSVDGDTPRHAIRRFCVQCMGGGQPSKEIEICCTYICPLWLHRFGRPIDSPRLDPKLLDVDHVKSLNAEIASKWRSKRLRG